MTDVDGITHWVSQHKLKSIGEHFLVEGRASLSCIPAKR